MEADKFSWCSLSVYERKKSDAIAFAEIAAGGLYKAFFRVSEDEKHGAIVMDSVVADKCEERTQVGLDVEVLNQDNLFAFRVRDSGIMTPAESTGVRLDRNRVLVVEEAFLATHALSDELAKITEQMKIRVPIGV